MPAVTKTEVKQPDPVPTAGPVQVDMKVAVKAALAKKKPAGWPREPSTKHRKGKA